MVIDTSALLTILFNEPEAESFEVALESDQTRLMSAASLLETSIVVEARLGEAGGRELDLLLRKAMIVLVPFTPEQAETARVAYRTYGKGRHPAGLNYGDCFAYALAKTSGEPLLCKGNVFPQTDITLWTVPQQNSPPETHEPG
jgi:ribonuclease VapC